MDYFVTIPRSKEISMSDYIKNKLISDFEYMMKPFKSSLKTLCPESPMMFEVEVDHSEILMNVHDYGNNFTIIR